MNEKTQPTIASEEIYQGKIVSLRIDTVRTAGGQTAKREIVEHPGAVAMCALDDQGQVFFVRVYRKPAEQEMLELPAGTREPGEEPETTARRELAEEIGYRPGTLHLLASYYSSPGYSTEQLYVYLATDLAPTGEKIDEHEIDRIERMPLAQAVQAARAGQFQDGKTIIGLLLADRFLSETQHAESER